MLSWIQVIEDLNRNVKKGTFSEQKDSKNYQDFIRLKKIVREKGNTFYVKWKI